MGFFKEMDIENYAIGCRAHWCELRQECEHYLIMVGMYKENIGDNLSPKQFGRDCQYFIRSQYFIRRKHENSRNGNQDNQ